MSPFNNIKIWVGVALTGLLYMGCSSKETLEVVTVKQFGHFVAETNYITDAERFGWSFVQQDILNFTIEEGVSWRMPYGDQTADDNMPVTQVSYNDALAYCKWSGTKLPSYEDYWLFTATDTRNININSEGIHVFTVANIIGNVWDITTSENSKGEIRLAGGSYLCSKNTCDGSNPTRKLFVDKTTGNSNIGFSILKN